MCKIMIKLTNRDNKLIIMNVYAPTLECSEKDPDTVDAFYGNNYLLYYSTHQTKPINGYISRYIS